MHDRGEEDARVGDPRRVEPVDVQRIDEILAAGATLVADALQTRPAQELSLLIQDPERETIYRAALTEAGIAAKASNETISDIARRELVAPPRALVIDINGATSSSTKILRLLEVDAQWCRATVLGLSPAPERDRKILALALELPPDAVLPRSVSPRDLVAAVTAWLHPNRPESLLAKLRRTRHGASLDLDRNLATYDRSLKGATEGAQRATEQLCVIRKDILTLRRVRGRMLELPGHLRGSVENHRAILENSAVTLRSQIDSFEEERREVLIARHQQNLQVRKQIRKHDELIWALVEVVRLGDRVTLSPPADSMRSAADASLGSQVDPGQENVA